MTDTSLPGATPQIHQNTCRGIAAIIVKLRDLHEVGIMGNAIVI